MARALMTNIRSEVIGDQIKLTFDVLYHGVDVNPPDRDVVTITMADSTTKANARAAIRTATLASASRLGYTVPTNALYTLEELFAGV